MSAQHRGLPPPAAMGLTPQQGQGHSVPPPSHHGQQPSMPSQPPPGPPSHGHHQRDSWNSQGSLPPPPQHWASSDDSMRNWLQARAEEEKTRQEEERTRQESLRLEQRKIEMDMLRASLGGGIPPPMVPLVFAGMGSGGILPQAALDWAHQFISSQGQPQHPQLLPPRAPTPESQREAASQQYQSTGQVVTGQAPTGYTAYGESPTRPRGQTISGVLNRPAAPSNLSGSNTPQSGQGLQSSTSTSGPFQQQQPSGGQSSQQDPSPSIYFHHWQPPATQSNQGGPSSNRPTSPPGDAQRKRKATDTHHQGRASTSQRGRSPQMFIQSDFTNPPTARKTHKRHKSDVSWYQAPRHGGPSGAEQPHRSGTPGQDNSSASSRDRDTSETGTKRPVSMFLSRDADVPPVEPRRDSYPDTYQERAPMPSRPQYDHHDHHPRERDSGKPERV